MNLFQNDNLDTRGTAAVAAAAVAFRKNLIRTRPFHVAAQLTDIDEGAATFCGFLTRNCSLLEYTLYIPFSYADNCNPFDFRTLFSMNFEEPFSV